MRRATRQAARRGARRPRGIAVREQVFWGWGEPGAGPLLPAHADAFLRDLGLPGGIVRDARRARDVRLRRTGAARGGARGSGGGGRRRAPARRLPRRACCAAAARATSTCSPSAPGDCEAAPDAVVRPARHDQVAAVAARLRRARRGGGAVRRRHERGRRPGGRRARASRASCRSTSAGWIGLESVDERSLTAVFAPGMRLPEAERALGAHGLRLAHVPQSFEWATVGGCVATRSAGQSSTGHGRIDENVVALRCATPAGELATLGAPGTAAGPSLRELVVGSEGALGVITRVALRVRPVAGGAAATRAGSRARSPTAPTRCGGSSRRAWRPTSRACPTRPRRGWASRWRAGRGGRRAGMVATRALGYGEGCLLVLGWEGDERAIGARRRPAAALLRKAGLLSAGKARRGGLGAPALRGARTCATTCSTAARSWRRSRPRRAGRARAAARRGRPRARRRARPAPSSAATSRTCIRRAPRCTSPSSPPATASDPAASGARPRRAAGDAIVAAGATITHHHAVGRDHTPWLEAERGPLGLELLRAAKRALRPRRHDEPRRARRALGGLEAAHVAHGQQRRRSRRARRRPRSRAPR